MKAATMKFSTNCSSITVLADLILDGFLFATWPVVAALVWVHPLEKGSTLLLHPMKEEVEMQLQKVAPASPSPSTKMYQKMSRGVLFT